MTGEYRPLRPNEVAGTWDVDGINAIMCEALGDDWASVFVTKDTGREVRPMLWSDYLPPQDAPAIGFRTELFIDDVPDTTPPTVTTPDPVADLVKGYKLIKDNPGYRSDPPGRDKWIRLSDVAINPDTLDDIIGAGYATALRDMAYQAARNLDGCLRDLPDGWSWCEHAFEWSSTDPGPFLADRVAFTARVKGHRLVPGETCPSEGRRTMYGPMTLEIRRAAGQ